MHTIKFLALDLDGTLTDSTKRISPYTLGMLDAAQRRGVTLIIASGRPMKGIEPIVGMLRLRERGGYVLAYNGGEVTDARTGECLFRRTLPRPLLPEIVRQARLIGLPLMSYRNGHIITEHPSDPYILRNSSINHLPVEGVPDLSEALAGLPEPPVKCLMTGDPEALEAAECRMREALGSEIEICRSLPYFMEIVAKGIDKAAGLGIILRRHHAMPEQLMACGDGDNDLSMIRMAGIGVAMENATHRLKAEAQFVTKSNDDDGVAYAVVQFIMNNV